MIWGREWGPRSKRSANVNSCYDHPRAHLAVWVAGGRIPMTPGQLDSELAFSPCLIPEPPGNQPKSENRVMPGNQQKSHRANEPMSLPHVFDLWRHKTRTSSCRVVWQACHAQQLQASCSVLAALGRARSPGCPGTANPTYGLGLWLWSSALGTRKPGRRCPGVCCSVHLLVEHFGWRGSKIYSSHSTLGKRWVWASTHVLQGQDPVVFPPRLFSFLNLTWPQDQVSGHSQLSPSTFQPEKTRPPSGLVPLSPDIWVGVRPSKDILFLQTVQSPCQRICFPKFNVRENHLENL